MIASNGKKSGKVCFSLRSPTQSLNQPHFCEPFASSEEETAANRAIVPFVLRLRYKDCPDFTQLNEKLCDLYGAIVDGDVRKYGVYQIINLSVQSLDDRYSIAGEPLVQECADLACGMLFDPYLENGLFSEEDVCLGKAESH